MVEGAKWPVLPPCTALTQIFFLHADWGGHRSHSRKTRRGGGVAAALQRGMTRPPHHARHHRRSRRGRTFVCAFPRLTPLTSSAFKLPLSFIFGATLSSPPVPVARTTLGLCPHAGRPAGRGTDHGFPPSPAAVADPPAGGGDGQRATAATSVDGRAAARWRRRRPAACRRGGSPAPRRAARRRGHPP